MIYLASLTEETEDKINGYNMLHSKEELDKVVANNSSSDKIIIRRDFASEYFTPSGLKKYIDNAKKVNRNLIITTDEKSQVITVDKFIKKLSTVTSEEEVFELLVNYPREFMDSLSWLVGNHDENRSEMLNASSTVSRLQSIIDEKSQKIAELESALRLEQNNKSVAQAKLNTVLNRINYQYNGGIDEKKLFEVDKNSYDKILYIKEITRVQFTDTLIYYLGEILRVLYNMPTRVCVIESYYAYSKEALYPNLVPHNRLTERDVISGDILMFGLQPKLMGDILKNPNRVSILIVLDRAGYPNPHIKGDNVEYVVTASDLKDVPEDIPKGRIISYSPETMFIPFIQNFDDLDSSERIAKYSSTAIIKQLVRLIEGR